MTAEVESIPGPKTDHTVENFISHNEIKQRHKTALMTAEVDGLYQVQKQTIQSNTSFLTMKYLTVSVLNSLKKGPEMYAARMGTF